MDNELLVKSIKAACSKRNISVTQLEKALEYSPSLISRWKKTSPSLDKIVDIADFLDISIDELIGREISIKSKTAETFVDILYSLTINNSIIWEDKTSIVPKLVDDDNCNIDYDGYDYYEMFISKYNDGIIYLYTQYDKEKGIINDIDIQLYIQPNESSELVIQECDDAKLYDLWYYIQAKFYGKPDEVQAEDFKQQFIIEQEHIFLNSLSKTVENIPNNTKNINELIADENAKKILTEVNSPEIQQLIDIFSDPKMAEAMQSTQKLIKYFVDIKNTKDDNNNND